MLSKIVFVGLDDSISVVSRDNLHVHPIKRKVVVHGTSETGSSQIKNSTMNQSAIEAGTMAIDNVSPIKGWLWRRPDVVIAKSSRNNPWNHHYHNGVHYSDTHWYRCVSTNIRHAGTGALMQMSMRQRWVSDERRKKGHRPSSVLSFAGWRNRRVLLKVIAE